MTKLVRYTPGQYADLIRGDGDAFSNLTCVQCGDAIGYAGYAERKGDRAPVHYITANGGRVLDCKAGTYFTI